MKVKHVNIFPQIKDEGIYHQQMQINMLKGTRTVLQAEGQ